MPKTAADRLPREAIEDFLERNFSSDPLGPQPRIRESPGFRVDRLTQRQRLALRAANDPVVVAPGGAGRGLGKVLLRAGLRGLGAALSAAGFAQEVVKTLREREDYESERMLEAQEEMIRAKLEKKRRDKEVRSTGVRGDAAGVGPPAESPNRFPSRVVLPVPTTPPVRPEIRPDIAPTIGSPSPDIQPPTVPEPTATPRGGRSPVAGTEVLPTGLPGEVSFPSGAPAPFPNPVPTPTPTPIGTPGFGVPGTVSPFPGPVSFPVPPPVATPFRQPVSDPVEFASPFEPLTAFEVGEVELPNPTAFAQPQPQPQQRCRPCPKDDPPEPRTSCFKGLYKEGRMDNEIDFTEWAEIDCETGEEL